MKRIAWMALVLLLAGCSSSQVEEKKEEPPTEVMTPEVMEQETVEVQSEVEGDEAVITLQEERIIQEESFERTIEPWGDVRFVSYAPDLEEGRGDVTFYLTKDGEVVYTFPYFKDTQELEMRLFESVEAVSYLDVNGDTVKDIVVIINYIAGVGLQEMRSRPVPRVFLSCGDRFVIDYRFEEELYSEIPEERMNIPEIKRYVQKANADRFLNSYEGMQYQIAASRFVKAFLDGDETYLKKHSIVGVPVDCYGFKDGYAKAEYIVYRNVSYDPESHEIQGEYVILPEKNGSCVYLDFTMRPWNEGWTLFEYHLDA